MFVMLADEADQDGSKEFLVYAAVFIPSQNALALSQKVAQIRRKHGFPVEAEFKFSTGTKPAKVTREAHTAAKNDVLEAAASLDCKTCCYLVPHAIAKGQTHENKLKFAVNTLLMKFNQFLRENGRVAGIALFDKTTDYKQAQYLNDVARLGVPRKDMRISLTYVVSIEQTREGNSHLNSVCDIIVGAYRFVMNEPDKDKVGSLLLRSLAAMIWGVPQDNSKTLSVHDRGLCIRPQTIEHLDYKADIETLKARLNKYQRLG